MAPLPWVPLTMDYHNHPCCTGSDYEALYRNCGKPAKTMVLVVEGKVPLILAGEPQRAHADGDAEAARGLALSGRVLGEDVEVSASWGGPCGVCPHSYSPTIWGPYPGP